MTDERALYRVRKTVLEMLRDRQYNIADAEIEETFEDFESRYHVKPSMNFLAHRPVASLDDADTKMEGDTMMEAIYVVFETKKEKLSADDIKKLVSWMHQYSDDKKEGNTQELLNCIIIVKGGATAIGKKVSPIFSLIIVFSNLTHSHPMCSKCSSKRSSSSTLLTTSWCQSTW